MILFVCPACRETYVVPPEFSGKEIQCRACKAVAPAQTAMFAPAEAPKVSVAAKTPKPGARKVLTGESAQRKQLLEFVCPVCGETYEVSEKLAGKKILCRVCGEPARAPSRDREIP